MKHIGEQEDAVGVAGKRLHAAAVGAATMAEWVGAGREPVSLEVAERRAMVCKHGAGDAKPCPHNWRGDWWTRVTAEVAATVMTQRAEKMRRHLMISNEQLLGTCDVCLCHLPVKCLVPIEHILHNTTDHIWNQLPPFCWIKHEGSDLRAAQKSSA